jgi:alpha-L-fucosidase
MVPKPPARTPPTKATVAKAFLLLLEIAPRERGKTKNVSFRAPAEMADWILENAEAASIERTDIMCRFVATLRALMEEAAPYANLLSVIAEKDGISPARAIARLAIERALQEYGELAKKLPPDKAKK